MGGWYSFQATCLIVLGGHMHAGAGASPLEETTLAAVSGTAMAGGKRQPVPPGPVAPALRWSCLWVLLPLLCPQSSVCSGAPCPAPPQGSCHSQGGIRTGGAPRHSLQLLQFLGATNISVNKEVCLLRVFLAASCPMTRG